MIIVLRSQAIKAATELKIRSGTTTPIFFIATEEVDAP
jgi:hypothetical protein